MAHSASNLQPYAKFIVESPIGSRYNARLCGEDKQKITEKLQTLHNVHTSRKEMLEQCQDLIGKPLTLAQLDGLRQELGLQQCRKRPSRHTAGTIAANGSITQSRLVTSEIRVADADKTTDFESDPTESEVDASSDLTMPLTKSSLLEGGGLSGDETTLEMETTYQHAQTTQLSACSSTHECWTAKIFEVTMDTSISVEEYGVLSTSGEESSDTAGVLLGTPELDAENFAPPQEPQMEIDSKWSAWEAIDGKPNPLPTSFANGARICEGVLAPQTEAYHPSADALGLFKRGMTRHAAEKGNIATLNKAANLFFLMNVFNHAFDLYLLIYRHFDSRSLPNDPPHAETILAAINCARSAQSLVQIEIASAAIKKTRDKLVRYCGIATLQSSETWRYLGVLHLQLSGQPQLLEREYEGWLYDAFLQNMTPGIAAKAKKLERRSSSGQQKDSTYWGAIALFSGEDRLRHWTGVPPDCRLSFCRDEAFHHLFECDITRQSISTALSKLDSFIDHNARAFDQIFGRKPSPGEGALGPVARTIACLFLAFNAHEETLTQLEPGLSTSKRCDRFPCDYNGHLVIILVFVLADWVESHSVSRSNLYGQARIVISQQFRAAIKQFTQCLSSSVSEL